MGIFLCRENFSCVASNWIRDRRLHKPMPRLLDRGDTPVILDVRAPRDLKKGALFVEGFHSAPADADRNISWLRLHCPHRRLARHPRRSWRVPGSEKRHAGKAWRFHFREPA
jgi:hypothetical protein